MISIPKNPRNSYMRRVPGLPFLILVVSMSSYSVVKAQNDPRSDPGPVKVQKITVNNKLSDGINNDSLVDVKIDYYKPDSTSAILDLVSRYTVAEKNNDPLTTGKKDKAIIYNEETQQQREAGEEEVRQIVEQVIQDPPKNFIYFLDEKESTAASIKKLNPGEIKTINFFKNEEAVRIYGEKARNGVIVLTTK